MKEINSSFNNSKILLYFPFKGIGGVSRVFLNIQKLFKKENIKLVDFEDGYMAKNTNDLQSLVNVKTVKNYPNNAIVLFQSFLMWNLSDFKKFPEEAKLIFWNLHPLNLYPYLVSDHGSKIKKVAHKLFSPLSFLRRKKVKDLVKYLIDKRSIFFMDYENKTQTENFIGHSIPNDLYLPLFVKTNFPIRKIASSKELLKLGYFGRLVDFKVYPLLEIIKRIDKFNKKFEFHIIGEGDSKHHLFELQKQLLNVELIFHTEVDLETQDQLLFDIDLFFAMGHSLLEIAARSIPVIAMNFSYHPLERLTKYDWAYKIENYNLAEEIKETKHIESKCSLEKMFIELESEYEYHSNKTYEWVDQNFSEEFFKVKFEKIVSNAQATFGDIKKSKLNKVDIISFIFKGLRNKKQSKSYFKQF